VEQCKLILEIQKLAVQEKEITVINFLMNLADENFLQ
jgi:hypothetical protein